MSAEAISNNKQNVGVVTNSVAEKWTGRRVDRWVDTCIGMCVIQIYINTYIVRHR